MSDRPRQPPIEDEAADVESTRTDANVERADPQQAVAERIEEMRAPDGATVLARLTSTAAADVAEYLDPKTAWHILAEMDPSAAASVIADMEPPEASMVLAEMDPDDRVDILAHIPAALHDELVQQMDAVEAAEVRRLEQYPPDTAGGIMTTEVTSLQEDLTVGQAIDELRRLSEELEQMFYVYVVDRRGHLVGVLSMRDLILARPETTLARIMRANVSSVPVTMDQEDVARFMRKYGFLAMPVVDARNRLLGLITVDDVVDVINEEATEDVLKIFGAGAEERLSSPWRFSFAKRVPWLLVNLLTAFLAASVIGMFEHVITLFPILAAYQTVVSGMGGNASAQAMAVAIRGIALGEVDTRMLRGILRREFLVGLCSGIVVGVVTAGTAIAFHYRENGVLLGLVICLALIFNHVNACVTGVAVPFIMKRLGFDPAQSASIIATTFTDCGGFFATLGLAALLQRWLM